MAGSARPLARVLRQKRHACALVVEPLEAPLHEVAVDTLPDGNGATHVGATAEQPVGSRSLDTRDIEGLHLLAAVIPVVHVRGVELEHRLAVQVAHFEAVRIVARVKYFII